MSDLFTDLCCAAQNFESNCAHVHGCTKDDGHDRKTDGTVECVVCHLTKKPLGRDAPAVSTLCTDECEGYLQEPTPLRFWFGESVDLSHQCGCGKEWE